MANGMLSPREQRFWNRYINRLHQQGIKPPFDRWVVRRAETFIKAFPNQRLAELTADDVSGYLTQAGRDGRLKAWQFRQVVDATWNLYSIVRVEWGASFDWEYWRDSARNLSPQHATTAREVAPTTPAEFAERLGDTRFAPLIRAHLELFTSMAAVIRTRGLAFRTEQTYMDWVCRFMLHFGGRSPTELGEAEVGSFLQHLAVHRNVAASTQNQALSALVFLYRYVLEKPLGEIGAFARAKRPKRLPVVLSAAEVKRVLSELSGVQKLVAS
ncbi:MAG: site-specific integrase, partial [Chloroflexota bacterium]